MPALTGTIDKRIDPASGQNSGESYGIGKVLPTIEALYHADTFGFYVTGSARAKRELSYFQFINLADHGNIR